MQDSIKVTGFLVLLAAAPAGAQKAVDRVAAPAADGLTSGPIQAAMPLFPDAADLAPAPADAGAKGLDLNTGGDAVKPAAASGQASLGVDAPPPAHAGPASAGPGLQAAETMARAEGIASELGRAPDDGRDVGLFSEKLRAVRSGLFPNLVRASPNGDRLLNYSGFIAAVFNADGKTAFVNTDDAYGSAEWLNNDQILISGAAGLRVYDLRTGSMLQTPIKNEPRAPGYENKPLYAKATGDYRYVVRATQNGGFDVWPNDGRFKGAARIEPSAYIALKPYEEITWPEFTAPPGSSKIYAFVAVGDRRVDALYGISRYVLVEIDAPTAQVRVVHESKTVKRYDMHDVELSRDGKRLIVKETEWHDTMAERWEHYGVPGPGSVVIDAAQGPKK